MTSNAPTSSKLKIALGAAAIAVLFSVVAIVRPARSHAAVENGAPIEGASLDATVAAATPAGAKKPRILGSDGPCSRPARTAPLAALTRADDAYDAGDYAAAKNLYLKLLLTGGGFGDPEGETLRWCHGRLALAVARLAVPPHSAEIDEPPLLFERGVR